MISYKFFIHANKDFLMLRILNNRRKAEMSTGVRMTAETLADAMTSTPTPSARKWRSMINAMSDSMDELISELVGSGRSQTPAAEIRDMAQARLLGKGAPDDAAEDNPVGAFARHFRSFTVAHHRERTQELYELTLRHLSKFDPDIERRTFEEITVDYLTRFEAYLALTSRSRNGRNIHLRNIRAVMRDAWKLELTEAHPFDRFKMKYDPTAKRSLTVEDLLKVWTVKVENRIEVYRDLFKLTFMLIGINPIDLLQAVKVRGGRLDYIRAKTHKHYSIKVEPEAAALIDKYAGRERLLRLAERRDLRGYYHQAARGMRSVAAAAGLPGVTFYWARHTWATLAYELDIPHDIIRQALGHGGGDVTSIYIRLDQKKVDEANRKVLDYVFSLLSAQAAKDKNDDEQQP